MGLNKRMEIPDWLKQTEHRIQNTEYRKTKEKFLDKTLSHVVSFTEDTMFNERVSAKKGLLQGIEPRLKTACLLGFIVVLSLQKTIGGIALFLLMSFFMAFASKVSFALLLKRLIPAAVFTAFIAMPATLNIIVKGEALLTLYTFEKTYSLGPIAIPAEVSITRQGLLSALTLFLRVIASVSIVFLLTLTTPPNRLIKAVSSFMPRALKSIVSISYRYIFFLVREVEQFIMGFKSRNVSLGFPKGRKTFWGAEQKWVASRVSLLFSISLRLSNELERAMESRGYKTEDDRFQMSDFRFSRYDAGWIIFCIIFSGAMIWKSLA